MVGVSSARNEGIRQAEGEYLMFLDADDSFDKKTLENCLPNIERKKQVFYFGCKWVWGETSFCTENSTKYYNLKGEKDRFKALKNVIYNAPLCNIWTGCYNKKFLIDNNLFFNESYHLGEDVLFNLTLYLYLDEYITEDFIGYYYNKTNIEAATNTKRADINQFVKMSYELYKTIEQRKIFFILKNYELYHDLIFGAGIYYVERVKEFVDAKKCLSKFKVTNYKDFHKKYMKKALKNEPKIIYNEFRPQLYIQQKCNRMLKKYSLDENKFSFYLKYFFEKFNFLFVKFNAKVKRRLKGLFKRKGVNNDS